MRYTHRFRLALLLVGALIAAGPGSARPAEGIVALPVQPEAPALVLPDRDGLQHDLSSYRGRLVLVNFWAVWCGPCRDEFPAMARAHEVLRDHGVVLLAVNSGDSAAAVGRFLRQYPLPFPVLLDSDSSAAGNWQVQGLPTTYLVTPDGRIYGGAVGARAWDSEAVLATIRRIAAEPQASTSVPQTDGTTP